MTTNITGTKSMSYNDGSQRANNSNVLNYCNRKIGSVGIKTDSVRLAFVNTNGEQQAIPGKPIGVLSEWDNIFKTVSEGGVVPTVEQFSPNVSSNWDVSTINSLVYNGEASLVSIYGHVVLKLNASLTTNNVLELGIFVNDQLIGDGLGGAASSTSPFSSLAVPDLTGSVNKATTDMTVNLVVPFAKGTKVELKMRNSTGSPIQYDFFQANLYARPIELTGTEAVTSS